MSSDTFSALESQVILRRRYTSLDAALPPISRVLIRTYTIRSSSVRLCSCADLAFPYLASLSFRTKPHPLLILNGGVQ